MRKLDHIPSDQVVSFKRVSELITGSEVLLLQQACCGTNCPLSLPPYQKIKVVQ